MVQDFNILKFNDLQLKSSCVKVQIISVIRKILHLISENLMIYCYNNDL